MNAEPEPLDSSLETLKSIDNFKIKIKDAFSRHTEISILRTLVPSFFNLYEFNKETIDEGLQQLLNEKFLSGEKTDMGVIYSLYKEPKKFSARLKALLIASKREEAEFDYRLVGKVLGDLYYPDMNMSLIDAFHHCLHAYIEAAEFSELEIPHHRNMSLLMEDLMKASLKLTTVGSNKIYPSITDSITLEQLYNCYISYILTNFRITNVGWCREELGFN